MTQLTRRTLLGCAAGGLWASLTASSGAAPTVTPWPSDARAAVSLTYDDGLNSQLDYAIPELDRRGLKATFFLTQENMADRVRDWEQVAANGHEVANHTVTHPCALKGYSAERFDRSEVGGMENFLNANFGPQRVRTYAYPCGYLGLGAGGRRARDSRYQRLLRTRFAGARTTAGGPNLRKDVRTDPFHLHAFEPTYEADTMGPAERYLRATVASGGWAIFVFHDVLPAWRGEGDASTKVHAAILDLVASQNLWCAPMGSVLARINPPRGL